MSILNRKAGIVNVRMVITEEKILSNIDKIQKIINPNNKKQIIELEEDTYFKDLIESIKLYLIEYPKKKNFPASVYKSSYTLVEFATNLFEDNTKKIEDLIRQREKNISLASSLKGALTATTEKSDGWKDIVKDVEETFPEDIIDTLGLIGRSRSKKTDNYKDAVNLIEARIGNLEANLHIEIDMERIEDRSKALSYIGIEIAEALKGIPAPIEQTNAKVAVIEEVKSEVEQFVEETRVEVKTSFWQRIKNSKIVRAVKFIFNARVVLQLPALPEGRGENN